MSDSVRKHRPVDLTLQGLVDLGQLDESSAQIIRRREHSLLSLLELTNELSVSLDPYEIADLLLFNLMGHLGTPKSSIWLLSKGEASKAVVLRSYGLPMERAASLGTICGGEIMRLIGDREAPIDVKTIGSSLSDIDRALIERSGLTLFAPVFARTSLLGIVGLGPRVSGEVYGTVDKQILQCSLGALGVALENTSLYSNLAEKNRQLAQAYEQVKEHNRLKSEFLRNVNHELRTPLTVILSFSQWLLSEEEDESKRGFLETVHSEGKKLNSLLEQLLDLSAVARDALDVSVEEQELGPTLEQFFLNRHLGVAGSLRELRYSAQSDLPPVVTDRFRLLQILELFVDNAIKFTPEGSRITLDARVVDEEDAGDGDPNAEDHTSSRWVRVEVRDNGQGIPKAQLADLFETFQQGDGSTSRSHGGLGLGLPLAKEVAKRMGASIEVTSEVGVGSVFSVLLPVASTAQSD